jgi:hypothetical protein
MSRVSARVPGQRDSFSSGGRRSRQRPAQREGEARGLPAEEADVHVDPGGPGQVTSSISSRDPFALRLRG